MKAPSFLNRLSKKRAIVLGVILLLLATSLLLRGWIRNDVAPAFVEITYGKRLAAFADHQTAPLKDKLTSIGFVLTAYTGYAPGKKCGLAYFHNFKETVVCTTGYLSEIVDPSEQQKGKLTTKGEEIEQWLELNGWSKEQSYYAKPLSAFFDGDFVAVDYRKSAGSTSCTFSLFWQSQSTYASTSPTVSASIGCSREIKFFGGNDSLHS